MPANLGDLGGAVPKRTIVEDSVDRVCRHFAGCTDDGRIENRISVVWAGRGIFVWVLCVGQETNSMLGHDRLDLRDWHSVSARGGVFVVPRLLVLDRHRSRSDDQLGVSAGVAVVVGVDRHRDVASVGAVRVRGQVLAVVVGGRAPVSWANDPVRVERFCV